MKYVFAAIVATALSFSAAAADNGIISKPSAYSVPATLDRLEAVLKSKGITVFAGLTTAARPRRWDSRCGRPSS